MDDYIFYRILGYLVTIALHGGNILVRSRPIPKELLEHETIKVLHQFGPRYLTGWTFVLQLTFAVAGLLCDILTLCNASKKGYRLPKHLKNFRDTLFSGIVWPSVLVVFTVFWIIFLYDRNLVYPEFIDQVISTTSNHIMHTAILPLVLWEVWFQPKAQPSFRQHKRYFGHALFHFALYISVLLYTYYESGVFIYPVLGKFYGTPYFPVFFAVVLAFGIGSYALQFVIIHYRWRNTVQIKKKLK